MSLRRLSECDFSFCERRSGIQKDPDDIRSFSCFLVHFRATALCTLLSGRSHLCVNRSFLITFQISQNKKDGRVQQWTRCRRPVALQRPRVRTPLHGRGRVGTHVRHDPPRSNHHQSHVRRKPCAASRILPGHANRDGAQDQGQHRFPVERLGAPTDAGFGPRPPAETPGPRR